MTQAMPSDPVASAISPSIVGHLDEVEPLKRKPEAAGRERRPNLLRQFIDAGAAAEAVNQAGVEEERILWARNLPYFLMHLACVAVIWVGFSWVALGVAVALYIVRMFFVTGFFHRYFSHKTFRTSRAFQFIMGLLCCTCAQRGPLWWAGHHRHHHKHSDEDPDLHSPRLRGFWWSHMLWFMSNRNFSTRTQLVPDLARFPELRWLDRFDYLPFFALGVVCYALGYALDFYWPELGTGGWQMFVWGWLISTVVCYHGTYTINSLSHVFGKQRYNTGDDSKNNALLALITLGEGWHNNHHHYPVSARQGFYWWEIDITYYTLWALSKVGLIWDVRPVPEKARERNRINAKAA
jgi:stearoyl-CoA desaturase (delta-9 desaturase)